MAIHAKPDENQTGAVCAAPKGGLVVIIIHKELKYRLKI